MRRTDILYPRAQKAIPWRWQSLALLRSGIERSWWQVLLQLKAHHISNERWNTAHKNIGTCRVRVAISCKSWNGTEFDSVITRIAVWPATNMRRSTAGLPAKVNGAYISHRTNWEERSRPVAFIFRVFITHGSAGRSWESSTRVRTKQSRQVTLSR